MAGGEPFYLNPTTWVAGAFAVFFGGLLYKGIHKKIGEALDARSDVIRKQIDEAKTLRSEAEKMLADYQRKQREAERDAQGMLDQAKEDAALMLSQAKTDIQAMVERRTKAASDKITQAEAQAVKEVKAAAVDVAVSATQTVLGETLKGKAGKELLASAIADVEQKLH